MEVINVRRSIRNFTSKEVEEEKIEELLRAGMQAPSALNQQPWEFIVIRKEETMKSLATISPYATPLVSASLAIIVVTNKDNVRAEGIEDQDMAACVQNILLEVVNQGLGAVWLGVKPVEERMKFISEMFSLPNNIEPFAIIAVGYSTTPNVFVDRFDESRIHFDKY